MVAQDVAAAFEAEGLNAFAYGVVCYDEWEGQDAVIGDDGVVHSEAITAGSRYGIRYEELLAFIIAAL